MKRRDFLKYSSIILPASAALGMINPFGRNTFAAVKDAGPFSLSVITKEPSRTIHTIEQAIKYSDYGTSDLDFTEYGLEGRHIGDIAYVRGQELIDYHKGTDEFSRLLRDSAGSLSLPEALDNPVLLRFSSRRKSAQPSGINIFRGETLVKQLSLDHDIDAYHIDGMKGHVDISVKNRSVKVVSASCKHKTCMNMSPISKPGENLVCVPNQVNVVIAGKSSLGVDSITF
jgi:hypothetical protein